MSAASSSSRPLPAAIIRQIGIQSRETRLAGTVALTRDIPQHNCSIEGLSSIAPALLDKLASGEALPVGSVEFVRSAMALAGFPEPKNFSYPSALHMHLNREVRQVRAGHVLGHWFVKPVATKAFNGFVFHTLQNPDLLDQHDREQYDAFMRLPPEDRVWISEPVSFVSEIRHYVLDGRVIGLGRYDDGDLLSPLPDVGVVFDMVCRMNEDSRTPVAYALDVGVLSSGETALVEVTDAWSIGYYSGTLLPEDYLRMLWARWQQMRTAKDPTEAYAERSEYSHD